MKVYRTGIIEFIDGTDNSTLVQIDSVSFDAGIENAINHGTMDVVFAGVLSAMPVLSFDTKALKTALSYIGYNGNTYDSVNVYLPQLESGGTIASGSVHTKISMDNAACYLQSITGSQGQEASASFRIYGVGDSTSYPVIISNSESLPQLSFTAEKYTVGTVYVDTTTKCDVQSITLNAGIEPIQRGANGDPYAKWVGVVSRSPNVEWTTTDVSLLDTIASTDSSPIGKKGNTCNFYFRKLENLSVPYADGDAQHIKISIAQMLVQPNNLNATSTDVNTLSLTGHAVYNGSDNIVAITTDVAIT